MLADDYNLFHIIWTKQDSSSLQYNIDAMFNWTLNPLLLFHPQNSLAMHVDGKSTGSINQATYKINHNILENKLTLKDFDEVVDNHLTFNNDIAEKVNNAKKIIGLIQRNLSTLIYVMKLWARKSSLTATKQPGGNFFYHLPACRVECVLKYIFSFKKTPTQTKSKRN